MPKLSTNSPILPADPRGSRVTSVLKGLSGGINAYNEAYETRNKPDLGFLVNENEGAVRGELTGEQKTAIVNAYGPAVGKQVLKDYNAERSSEMSRSDENRKYGRTLREGLPKAQRVLSATSDILRLADKDELPGTFTFGRGSAGERAKLRAIIEDVLSLTGQEGDNKAAEDLIKSFNASDLKGKKDLLKAWRQKAMERSAMAQDFESVYKDTPAILDLEGHLVNLRAQREDDDYRRYIESVGGGEEEEGVPSEKNRSYQTYPTPLANHPMAKDRGISVRD